MGRNQRATMPFLAFGCTVKTKVANTCVRLPGRRSAGGPLRTELANDCRTMPSGGAPRVERTSAGTSGTAPDVPTERTTNLPGSSVPGTFRRFVNAPALMVPTS